MLYERAKDVKGPVLLPSDALRPDRHLGPILLVRSLGQDRTVNWDFLLTNLIFFSDRVFSAPAPPKYMSQNEATDQNQTQLWSFHGLIFFIANNKFEKKWATKVHAELGERAIEDDHQKRTKTTTIFLADAACLYHQPKKQKKWNFFRLWVRGQELSRHVLGNRQTDKYFRSWAKDVDLRYALVHDKMEKTRCFVKNDDHHKSQLSNRDRALLEISAHVRSALIIDRAL